MGVDRPIDITEEQRKTILSLLKRHLPNTTTWVYGSRVRWTSRPKSDLDMVVFATPAQDRQVAGLREAFEDSDLPFRVDLFVWEAVPESHRSQIEADYAVLAREESSLGSNTWQKVSVDEIADKVAMGPFGSSIKVNTFVPSGIPIISGQHLHGIRVDDAPGFNFIAPEHAERLANANVRRGDVIFTHAGNIGQVSYIPRNSKFDRYVISQRQFYMRCDPNRSIPEYIALYFNSPEGQHQLLANASQVGVPAIAQPVTYLRTIEIPLPPLREQRAIAQILSILDDKIEVNGRMICTLDVIARTLFKSWFVDFDPVRAKIERHDPELRRSFADLFPDTLVDSELGKIPQDWKISCIRDQFQLTMGQSPPSHTYNKAGDGIPFYQGRADFSFRFPRRRVFCTAPTRTASMGDTLVSVRAPVGDINMASEDCAIGRGLAALRHNTKNSSYSFYSLRALQKNFVDYEAQGTVFGSIGKKDIGNIPCIVPPTRVIEKAESVLADLDERIKMTEAESQALFAVRESLLPNLVSGRIRTNAFFGE